METLVKLGFPLYCRNWVKRKIEGVVQIRMWDNVEVDVLDNAVETCKRDNDEDFDIWGESSITATLVQGDFHESNSSNIDGKGKCWKIHLFLTLSFLLYGALSLAWHIFMVKYGTTTCTTWSGGNICVAGQHWSDSHPQWNGWMT